MWGARSTPSFADLDGDGDLDAIVGESDGILNYFENTGAGFALVVNVTAQNDAAVLSADVRNLTETNAAADISSSGTLTISDVDSPATFVAQAGTAGSYGTFAIDSAGAWTYTASSAHDEFVAGTTYTDTFAVASADGTPTSVTINILGTNDAAVLSADVRNLTETNAAPTLPPPARSPSATSTARPPSWRRPAPSAATAPSPSTAPAPGPTPQAPRTTSSSPAPPTPTPSRSPAPTARPPRSPSTSSAPTTPRCSPPTSAT